MIQIFDSMTELLESVPKENMTFEMCNAFVKAWGKIHGYGGGKSEVHPFTMYPKIMVSVSGGADSDIVLDLVERIGYPLSEVHYAFFDTGLEFAASQGETLALIFTSTVCPFACAAAKLFAVNAIVFGIA